MLEFIRDGHQDAIIVKRFNQTAGTLHFDGSAWHLNQHGGSITSDGRIRTVSGVMTAKKFSEGYFSFWRHLENQKWPNLKDAMQTLAESDPKQTNDVDFSKLADKLIINFRKYTAYKNAI